MARYAEGTTAKEQGNEISGTPNIGEREKGEAIPRKFWCVKVKRRMRIIGLIGKDMAGTIWVYVKGEQKQTAENALVYAESGHSCSGTKSALVYKKEHVLPESHKQMVSVARKVAEEKGMRLQICDISSRIGSLRARLAHVSKTPIMIFGNKRIVENITEEKLSSILERTCSAQPIDTH